MPIASELDAQLVLDMCERVAREKYNLLHSPEERELLCRPLGAPVASFEAAAAQAARDEDAALERCEVAEARLDEAAAAADVARTEALQAMAAYEATTDEESGAEAQLVVNAKLSAGGEAMSAFKAAEAELAAAEAALPAREDAAALARRRESLASISYFSGPFRVARPAGRLSTYRPSAPARWSAAAHSRFPAAARGRAKEVL